MPPPRPVSRRTIPGGSGRIAGVMYDSTPGAMLFGLRLLLRVSVGPILLGGGLTLAAALLLQAVAAS